MQMHERIKERKELIQIFKRGGSAQLLAPRRIGKTWLIDKVAKDLRAEDWLAVVVDVEGMQSIDEFLRKLCRKIQDIDPVHKQVFSSVMQRLHQLAVGELGEDPVAAIGYVNTKDFAEALVSSLNKQDRDTIILIDEIALFVLRLLRESEEETRDFLYSLRGLQQGYPKVRWLLTGSIGLDAVARRSNLQGALVDFEIFKLLPFDLDAARAYVETLCKQGAIRNPFAISEDDFEYLAQELGWLAPYYLKLVANRVDPTGPENEDGRRTATQNDVDNAFEELLSPSHRVSFAVWEEHIDKNFEERNVELLRHILYLCCETSNGLSKSELSNRLRANGFDVSQRKLMDLLTILYNGGVLVDSQKRWRFSSGLIRRYWLEYWHE